MTTLTADDRFELRDLACGYAAAVDARDTDGFTAVFAPDAVLQVRSLDDPDRPTSELRGHEQLARVTAQIARFERTFHDVGQSRYEADGDGARGEVLCTAHHLTDVDGRRVDVVMLIRYQDRYVRADDGWRIAERHVDVQWTDVCEVQARPGS